MSYPISTPTTFDGTGNPGAEIDFDATGANNKVLNFVATTAGDILFRQAAAPNYLDRLPIGAPNFVLQSIAGLPSWTNAISNLSQGVFTATVTASLGGVPTSRVTGAWNPLSGVVAGPAPYVTWSTAAPASDPDAVFTTAAGVNYGRFTVPATGIYTLSSQVAFDSGVGVNAGAGLPAAPLPSGTAVRQARIFNVTTGSALAVTTTQNAGSNNNQTVVWIVAENVSLTTGDLIEIQVRHDRSGAGTVTIGNVAIAVPFQTYFTGKRVR